MSVLDKDTKTFAVVIDGAAKAHLLETARWAKFLGWFMCILLFIISVVLSIVFHVLPPYNAMAPSLRIGMSMGEIVFVFAINFFPIYALIKFGNRINKSFEKENQLEFNSALKFLKNYFKYIGIMIVIVVLIYSLVIAFLIFQALTNPAL